MLMKTVLNKMGYYYDCNTNTLYMSKAFERKTNQYGSEACKMILEMEKMFPGLTIEVCARAAKVKPLSYKQMKEFINLLPTAKADLEEMERQMKMSVAFKSPYKFVERWFNEKYPYHKEYKVEKDGETVWDIAALCHKATAEKNNISELPAQQENAEETSAA